MISYQIIEHGKPLQKVMHETPVPKGTEVLVKITRSGVCHSDVHIWDGYFDWGGGKRFYVKERGCIPPFTLGHEPFGVVAAVGPRAKGVKLGQKKIVYPWIGCGKCPVCKAGQDNYCMKAQFLGVMKPGGYSSHVLIPHPKYLVDAAGIDEGFAATLGDPDAFPFEDPVIMSDAVLWMARQPLGWTGQIVTISELRARGAVRPETRAGVS